MSDVQDRDDRGSSQKSLWDSRCERDASGALTPLALALVALECRGCECRNGEQGVCLVCRCRAAIQSLWDELQGLRARRSTEVLVSSSPKSSRGSDHYLARMMLLEWKVNEQRFLMTQLQGTVESLKKKLALRGDSAEDVTA